MARPVDLTRKIKDILQHTERLPDAAKAPILHYQRSVADIWTTLAYAKRVFDEKKRSQAAVDRHLVRLYGMALVNLVETFERFLKEVAASCVDVLADFVVDDRFNAFKIQGSNLASHFNTETLGKSLCESQTWLDCKEINDRFRALLADPFQPGNFYLFPQHSQQPLAERWRYETLSIVWQLRHTSVHNVGVVTRSDAVKLRQLAREPVASPRVLCPTRADLTYLKRFLDETARSCNRRVGERLAELLTHLHGHAPALLDRAAVAQNVTETFRVVLQVAGVAGVVPPS